jgi:iduronate 2-sulfatase
MGYAMRTDQYRYIEWQDKESGAVRARELYDHSKDPRENVNLADRVSESLLKALSEQLNAGWEHARPKENAF